MNLKTISAILISVEDINEFGCPLCVYVKPRNSFKS